jgi:predicted nuclease of restriction endonuclease-like RecB superfamily
MKKVTSTAEWKKTNSEAQLLIQGTPEQKKKNAEAVSKACKRPSVKKKKSESAKKMWKDPEYRKKGLAHLQKIHSDPKVIEKQQLKNRFHTGYYESKFGRMFFNSSWELSFIKYCENNDYVDMMSRFNGYIEYIDCEGVARKYFPDFVVEIRGHKFIVEIKGGWEDSDIIKRKCDAARKFVELNDEYDDFFIYRKRELEKLGVLNETYESN